MAGGYESEDRQAELEELRREQEREAWELQRKRREELERRRHAAGPPGPPADDARPVTIAGTDTAGDPAGA